MKFFVSVILIFSIVLTGGIFHFIFVKNNMNTLTAHTELLFDKSAVESVSEFKSELENLKSDWSKMRSKLCLVIDHNCIFEIDGIIGKIENLYPIDFTEYSLLLSDLKSQINSVTESASFNLENVL